MPFPRFMTALKSFSPKLLLALLAGLVFAGTANAWWDGDWTIRKKIVIDTAGVPIGGAIGTVPVLLRLHDGDFQFPVAKEDGSDIRFVAEDDKTVLDLPHREIRLAHERGLRLGESAGRKAGRADDYLDVLRERREQSHQGGRREGHLRYRYRARLSFHRARHAARGFLGQQQRREERRDHGGCPHRQRAAAGRPCAGHHSRLAHAGRHPGRRA